MKGAEVLKKELEQAGKKVTIIKQKSQKLSPELLWIEACEYFQKVDENPLYKSEMIRGGEKAGQVVKIATPRPYTWTGLEEHLFEMGIASSTIDYRYEEGPVREEFRTVVEAINTIIKRNKFDGAAAGLFNPMIIARDLGLTDKTQTESVNVNLEQQIDFSQLSTEALEEITALMDKQKRLE